MNISFNPAIKYYGAEPLDNQIKKKLEELGLQSTGSKEGDLRAIKEAAEKKGVDSTDKISQTQETQGAQQSQQAPQTPPEIAAFMRGIGATPTNSKEGDAAAVQARLNELSTKATDKTQMSVVDNLRNEWQQLTASVDAQGAGNQQSGSGDVFAGQDQLAKLNKHFLVK